MSKIDGGPAFPNKGDNTPEHEIYDGMSLRDWFAGQALTMDWTGRGFADVSNDVAERVAKACFEIADAMIAAREESNGSPRENDDA